MMVAERDAVAARETASGSTAEGANAVASPSARHRAETAVARIIAPAGRRRFLILFLST
jgi:hypothetical protein